MSAISKKDVEQGPRNDRDSFYKLLCFVLFWLQTHDLDALELIFERAGIEGETTVFTLRIKFSHRIRNS